MSLCNDDYMVEKNIMFGIVGTAPTTTSSGPTDPDNQDTNSNWSNQLQRHTANDSDNELIEDIVIDIHIKSYHVGVRGRSTRATSGTTTGITGPCRTATTELLSIPHDSEDNDLIITNKKYGNIVPDYKYTSTATFSARTSCTTWRT